METTVKNLRIFKVKFVSREGNGFIEIKEGKFYQMQKQHRILLPYDYDVNDVQNQAIKYLISKGFQVVGRGSEINHYYVIVDNFGAGFMNLKGEIQN